jgi:hypothetical protein
MVSTRQGMYDRDHCHIESFQHLLFPGLIDPFQRLIDKGRYSLDKRRHWPSKYRRAVIGLTARYGEETRLVYV